MKAVVIEEYGPPSVLKIREIPRPSPGPQEVRVRVAATALNRAELLQRQGLYPPPEPRPEHEVPGLEFAGTVDAVGSRVTAAAVGDRVCGLLPGGGYAESVVTHEHLLIPVPDRLSLLKAAAIPESWLTAYDALVPRAKAGSGERVLIHAGGSGVGTAAIQIALAMGAQVFTTVRTPWKAESCASLGAQKALVFDVKKEPEALVDLAGSRGFDVILDFAGASYLAANLDAAALEGRIILIGLLGGAEGSIGLGTVLRKRLQLQGTTLRPRPVYRKMQLTEDFCRNLLPLFASGQLTPVIDRTFPLEQVVEAHTYMEANKNFGKILLKVDPSAQ